MTGNETELIAAVPECELQRTQSSERLVVS